MEPTSTFAASGKEAITQTIDLHDVPDELSPAELEEYYDVERTVEYIRQGDYKRVNATHLNKHLNILTLLLYRLLSNSRTSCCVTLFLSSDV